MVNKYQFLTLVTYKDMGCGTEYVIYLNLEKDMRTFCSVSVVKLVE